MAVVLFGPPGDVGTVLVPRLLAEGDEVRVVEAGADAGARWRELGAFVAATGEWDADLVERATQEARTIVLFDSSDHPVGSTLPEIVEGARLARVDRIVVVLDRRSEEAVAALEAAALDYVLLVTGGRRVISRRAATDPGDIAAAVDAADDLAGNPRLVVDLPAGDAGRLLGL